MRNLGFNLLKAVCAASAFGATALCLAADRQVEELLSHMRVAYATNRSVTYTTQSHFGQVDFTSSFTYQNPNKIRVLISSPNSPAMKTSLIQISDGKRMNVKLPNSMDFAEKAFSVQGFEQQLPVNLESLCFFDWEQQLSTAPGKNMEHSTFQLETNQPWNGRSWTVLVETAPRSRVVCRYYVDPKTYFIWRTVVKPMQGGNPLDASDCQITKLTPGAKVDSSDFHIVHV
ncbi:MAG: hypothetical protein P4L46_24210 [Fimbriimonas sp.]|nr:hypothetical protein [Fimbriimonas sp.]